MSAFAAMGLLSWIVMGLLAGAVARFLLPGKDPMGCILTMVVGVAGALLGVVSQRLVPRTGGGLIPAVEILIANYAVRNIIRENKIHQLDLVIETGVEEGMVSLNRSLADLVRQGFITLDTAELYSLNPSELSSLLSQ